MERLNKLLAQFDAWLNSLTAPTKPRGRKPQATDEMDSDILIRSLNKTTPNAPSEGVLRYFNGQPSEAARTAVISTLVSMHRENYKNAATCKYDLSGKIIATLNAFDTTQSLEAMAEIAKTNYTDALHVISLLCTSDNTHAAATFYTIIKDKMWQPEHINTIVDKLAENPNLDSVRMMSYCAEVEYKNPLPIKTKILETVLNVSKDFCTGGENPEISHGLQHIIKDTFEYASKPNMIESIRTRQPEGIRLRAVFDRIVQTPYIAQHVREEAARASRAMAKEQREADAELRSWSKEGLGLVSPEQSPR